MSNAFLSMALAGGFLLAQGIQFLVMYFAGGLFEPLYRPLPDAGLRRVYRLACGVALAFALAAWTGCVGWLNPWAVLSALAAAGVVGARLDPVRVPLWPRRCGFLRAWIPGLLFGAISANMLIGAMVPDMSQDSMWYHLAVPQEWGFSGFIRPIVSVMPSCYPLAAEAWYAVLIPVLGPVGCSVWYASITLFLIVSCVVVAKAFAPAGWRLAAALFVPLLAATAVAPVPAGNDHIASLFLLLAWAAFILPAGPHGYRRRWLLAGLLAGTACAAKPVVLGLFPPLAVIAILNGLPTSRDRIRGSALLLVGALVAYMPWLVIGLRSTGLPAFPLGASVFAFNEAYADTLFASRKLNSLYPLTLDGINRALTAGLHDKALVALVSGNVLLPVTLVATLVAAATCQGARRVWSIAPLFAFLPTIMMMGKTELFRYYGLLFPLGILPLAAFFDAINQRISANTQRLVMAAFLVGGLYSLAVTQYRVATFRTIQWPFRPMLTQRDALDYASRAETGALYIGFHHMRHVIPPGQRVFLADVTYPFYLHRPAVWQDVVVNTKELRYWSNTGHRDESAAEALARSGAQWVLVTDSFHEAAPLQRAENLTRKGILTPSPLPPEVAKWRLYRVVNRDVPPGARLSAAAE